MGHGKTVPRNDPSTPVKTSAVGCGAPRQLPLEWSDRDAVAQAWPAGLELLRAFVTAKTLKEVAYALDEQPSGLAHELAERDYREPKARLLVLAVMRDKTRTITQWLCRLAGGRFVEDAPLTVDEELRRTREWLSRNPAVERAWAEEVHGRKT